MTSLGGVASNPVLDDERQRPLIVGTSPYMGLSKVAFPSPRMKAFRQVVLGLAEAVPSSPRPAIRVCVVVRHITAKACRIAFVVTAGKEQYSAQQGSYS
jgi:hypothetical protein